MRLKERGPNEIGPYCNSIGGTTTFYFKKSEYDHIFSEMQDYINELYKRHSNFSLNLDFNFYTNGACLYWWRKLTDDEKDKVRELNKADRKSRRNKEKAMAVKLAKKYKLI